MCPTLSRHESDHFNEETYPVKIFFSFLLPIGDESLIPVPEADDIPVVVISPSENKYVTYREIEKSTHKVSSSAIVIIDSELFASNKIRYLLKL